MRNNWRFFIFLYLSRILNKIWKKSILLNESGNDNPTLLESLSEEEINYVYERKYKLDEKSIMNNLGINDILNLVGFIFTIPALAKPFYEKFFKTKIFFNFI